MNKPKAITVTLRAVALVGAFSLVAASSQAAFVGLPNPTGEVPGVLLGGLTATGGGTILASLSEPFSNAFNTGTFNTWVVDRDPGAGVSLDFYYQVVNTTAVPPPTADAQVWRVKTLGGFTSVDNIDPVFVAQTDVSPVGGPAVVGLKPARTADRGEGSPGSVGFEFPVAPGFTGDPLNVAPGQSSTFMVVRTNSSSFEAVAAAISSGDTSLVRSFAAVPEPSSVLFGLAMFGVALTNRARARASKAV